MRPSSHLGRVAGVRIGVDWSVLIIAVGLAVGRFAVDHTQAGCCVP